MAVIAQNHTQINIITNLPFSFFNLKRKKIYFVPNLFLCDGVDDGGCERILISSNDNGDQSHPLVAQANLCLEGESAANKSWCDVTSYDSIDNSK